MLPSKALSQACFSCSESACRAQHLAGDRQGISDAGVCSGFVTSAREFYYVSLASYWSCDECVTRSPLDRKQLEAETSIHVLQRLDGTQSEILEQNHGVLLQHQRHITSSSAL